MSFNNPWEQNRRAWDARARDGDFYAKTASAGEFHSPLTVLDECGWITSNGGVSGCRVLCLAAGGGRHGVLFAAAGAIVTVVDISPAMLELDRTMAERRGLNLRTVTASMDNLSCLEPEQFDLVVQPVSSCYVPDVVAVYRQVARVAVSGALYISQHKQPASLQAEPEPVQGGYLLKDPYYRREALKPASPAMCHRESGTQEFMHSWEALIGGLCQSGFVVEDLVEPRHARATAIPGSLGHRSFYLPPFVTIKARRTAKAQNELGGSARLWIP